MSQQALRSVEAGVAAAAKVIFSVELGVLTSTEVVVSLGVSAQEWQKIN
jgi:hypothetical protein